MENSQSAPLQHHCPPEARKFVIIVAFLASAMGFIDGTIVAIALPQIREALGASFAEAQWISNSYVLFLSAFILIGGGLGDRLGIKATFMFGIAFFVVFSIACVFAWNPESLVFFRALQGVGAAIMLPGSMALIARNFPRAERGKALGLWVASSSITTAMGPVLGGLLLTYGGDEGWRWIFAINVPIGGLAIWLLMGFVPADPAKEAGGIKALDWTGAVLLTIGMGLFAAGLTFLGEGGAGRSVSFACLISGTIVSTIAIWWELKVPNAMIDMRLFKSVEFSGVNLVTFLVWAAIGSTTFFLPMLVIVGWKLPPTYAGSMFLAFSFFITLLSPMVGKWTDRFGTRPMLTLGSVIYVVGSLHMAWAIFEQDYWFGLLPAMGVLGIAIGLMGSTVAAAVMNSVPEDKTGAASGINNMMARASFMFAVAGLGAFLAYAYAAVVNSSKLPDEIKSMMVEAGFGERLTGALYQISTIDLQVVAMNHAMIALFLLNAVLGVLSAVVSWFTQTGPREAASVVSST